MLFRSGGSLLGGLADITPVGSGYELLTGRDIITGEDLHLSGFDQALNVLDVGLTLLPWARPLRTLAMSHPTAATRLLLGGSAFAGAYLFAGGGIQTAEAGYAKAIGQFAKTARSLPRGAWSLGNGARGFLLEARRIAQMGAQKLPAGFKTFDHIDHATRTAVSIKSMDLLGSSYATAEAILRRGYGVIDDIASFRYAQRRGVELRKGHDFVRTRLEMIIPPGATPAQLQALDQVRAYARSQKVGFKLMVRS